MSTWSGSSANSAEATVVLLRSRRSAVAPVCGWAQALPHQIISSATAVTSALNRVIAGSHYRNRPCWPQTRVTSPATAVQIDHSAKPAGRRVWRPTFGGDLAWAWRSSYTEVGVEGDEA